MKAIYFTVFATTYVDEWARTDIQDKEWMTMWNHCDSVAGILIVVFALIFTGKIRIRFDQRGGSKRTARIDLWFARQVTGFSFDIGDSPTVNGWGNKSILLLFLSWQQQYDLYKSTLFILTNTLRFIFVNTLIKHFNFWLFALFSNRTIESKIICTSPKFSIYVTKVEMLGQPRTLRRCMEKIETCSYFPTYYLVTETTLPTATCWLKRKRKP